MPTLLDFAHGVSEPAVVVVVVECEGWAHV